MYNIINSNIDLILAHPKFVQDIADYLRLLEGFREADVSRDTLFQSEYQKYWKMNAARLDGAFYAAYFDLLEKSKENNDLNVERIVETLYRAHRQKGLQFSFASKLVHMIKPHKPIYDSFVASFYFYIPLAKTPQKRNESDDRYFERDINTRLTYFREFYDYLIKEYARIIECNLLQPSINVFRNHFPQCTADNCTCERVIDYLIWYFVDAVRSRRILYF